MQGRYRPRCSSVSRRPPVGKDPPHTDLTGCFVQSDRSAVYKQGLSSFGGLGGCQSCPSTWLRRASEARSAP